MTETWFTRMMTCESHSSGIQSSKVLRAMGVYPPSRVRGDHEAEGDEPPQSPHGECSGFVIPDASPPTIQRAMGTATESTLPQHKGRCQVTISREASSEWVNFSGVAAHLGEDELDRKSTRLNSSH